MILAALALLGTIGGPVPVGQAPVKYQVDIKMTQSTDLTSAGMGIQESGVAATAFINLTMRDTTDGKIAHIVVDSMTVSAKGQLQMMFQQALADSIRGEYLDAHIVDGRSKGTPEMSTQGNPVLGLVAQSVGALFPGVGSKAAGRTTWSDTTNSTTIDGTNSLTSNQVIAWTVNSTDGDVLNLSGTSKGTLNGDQSGQQMSGTITGTITASTPIGGPVLTSDLSVKQDIIVLAQQATAPINVNVDVEVSAKALP